MHEWDDVIQYCILIEMFQHLPQTHQRVHSNLQTITRNLNCLELGRGSKWSSNFYGQRLTYGPHGNLC